MNLIKAVFLFISLLLLFKDSALKAQTSDDSLRLIWNNEQQLDCIRFHALTGDIGSDFFRRSISLYEKCNMIAIGTPFNSRNGAHSCQTRILKKTILATPHLSRYNVSYYPNPNPNFVTIKSS